MSAKHRWVPSKSDPRVGRCEPCDWPRSGFVAYYAPKEEYERHVQAKGPETPQKGSAKS